MIFKIFPILFLFGALTEYGLAAKPSEAPSFEPKKAYFRNYDSEIHLFRPHTLEEKQKLSLLHGFSLRKSSEDALHLAYSQRISGRVSLKPTADKDAKLNEECMSSDIRIGCFVWIDVSFEGLPQEELLKLKADVDWSQIALNDLVPKLRQWFHWNRIEPNGLLLVRARSIGAEVRVVSLIHEIFNLATGKWDEKELALNRLIQKLMTPGQCIPKELFELRPGSCVRVAYGTALPEEVEGSI